VLCAIQNLQAGGSVEAHAVQQLVVSRDRSYARWAAATSL